MPKKQKHYVCWYEFDDGMPEFDSIRYCGNKDACRKWQREIEDKFYAALVHEYEEVQVKELPLLQHLGVILKVYEIRPNRRPKQIPILTRRSK